MRIIFFSLLTLFPNVNFAVDYKSDIMPIMKEHCFECHSGENYKGSLNLDKLDEISRHIGKYNAIIPGNEKEGSFIEKMRLPETAKDFMPRKGSKLPDKQLDLIAKWLKGGAIVDSENPTEDEQKWAKENGVTLGGSKGGSGLTQNSEYLKWSNKGKTMVIDARFMGLKGDAVKLLNKKDRKIYEVKFEKLSPESVALAKRLAGK